MVMRMVEKKGREGGRKVGRKEGRKEGRKKKKKKKEPKKERRKRKKKKGRKDENEIGSYIIVFHNSVRCFLHGTKVSLLAVQSRKHCKASQPVAI